MSHVVAVQTRFRSLEAVEKAANKLGLELIRDKKTYNWYGVWVNDYHGNDAAYKNGVAPENYGKCEHVLARKGVKGAYEIGLVAAPDGDGFLAIFDYVGTGRALQQLVGDSGEKLATAYTLAVLESQAAASGWQLTANETATQTVVTIDIH